MSAAMRTQIATWVGCFLAILIAVLDTWVFGARFTSQVDLSLLFVGLGGLIGSTIPIIGTVASSTATK